MARPSLALRRRGQIGIPQFLQFRTSIPNRSGTGTRQGNGRVCAYRSSVGMAGDLHARDRRQIAEHGATIAVAVQLGALRAISVSAKETRPDIGAFLPARNRGA